MRKNKTPKDPITKLPLRDPGQSLRESLDDLIFDTVAPWLSIAILSVLVAALEVLRWWLAFPPKPVLFSVAAIFIVLVTFRKIRIAKRKARDIRTGLKGEQSIGQLLQTELLPLGYHVFHDCCFEGFNVDHVAIGPGGVFAIETKTRFKRQGDARVRYDGEKVTIDGREADRDAVAQAKAGGDRIASVFKEFVGRTVYIRPVVLFPGWYVDGKSGGSAVWVLNQDAFITWVKKETPRLKTDEIQLLAAGLACYIRSTL